MSVRRDALAAAVGALLGVGAGWRRPAVPLPPPSVDAKRPARVVCTRTRTEAPEDCAAVEVRRDWCYARLTAATRPRPTSAPPEAVGVDDPVDWARRRDGILQACHVDAQVVGTDCAEYPCVSALRASGPAALEALGGPCVGVGEHEWPALLPVPVACGDHTETLWMFAVVDQPTLDELYPKAAGQFIPNEIVLLGGRRAESLAKGWKCGSGGAG